jgi:phosphoesterase RecJ-like protein
MNLAIRPGFARMTSTTAPTTNAPPTTSLKTTATATITVPTTTTTHARDAYVGTARINAIEGPARALPLPPLQPRRLPDLDAALVDPAITVRSPRDVAVPDDVMAALRSAKRVLVIGHVPPDGDCVGSAAGLCAALRAAGKEAVAVVDDALPASSRAIANGGVHRAADVAGQEFDLVVVVDVAAAARIGGAAAHVANAAHVLVIDHHKGGPTREGLGLRADAKLTTWNDPDADAAAVLVAGVAARLDDTGAAFAAAQRPLAAAMYTDTLGFKAPGASIDTLRLFKGVIDTPGTLAALRASLQPPMPPAVAAVLDASQPTITKAGARLVVDSGTWNQALDTARRVAPELVLQDLRGHLADRLDALRDAHGFASLAIDEGVGVRISLRSLADGPAHDVATALGGGGHGRAAASFLRGVPLDEALQKLSTSTTQMQLAIDARVRTGRLV